MDQTIKFQPIFHLALHKQTSTNEPSKPFLI